MQINLIVDKATCALYDVPEHGRLHNLYMSIQSHLDLFNDLIKPKFVFSLNIFYLPIKDKMD
jgi:hypothetical protein